MIFNNKQKTPPYAQIHKHVIESPDLSAKAKWILIYLLSKPPEWKVYESDIVKHCKDGKQSVRTGIRELIKAGYIRRGQNRNIDGKFGRYEYDVSDTPEFVEKVTEVRLSDIGKSEVSNIDINNTRKKPYKKRSRNKTWTPEQSQIANALMDPTLTQSQKHQLIDQFHHAAPTS